MKKKLLVALLVLTMAVSALASCGKKPEQSVAEPDSGAVESLAETTSTAEPEATAEPKTTAEPEATAEPKTTAEPESKEPENGAESTEAVESKNNGDTAESQETIPPAGEGAESGTPTEQAAAYTVTEMTALMYVQNSVNLRQGPGTGYAKVGSLNQGDPVNVIGQADNGWYQLDNGAFVSNKYLGDAVPVQQTAATTPVDPTVPADAVGEMGVISNTTYVANATDFFNYMNQQRSVAGLGTLTWDDGMAAVAQRRAKELATDYSHNGNVEMYGENIHNNTSGSYIDWYNSFYKSSAHRETMMTANYGRGAAAVYFDGYKYYVVCNFAGTPIAMEQLIEQAKPENLVPAGGNESGTTTGFSTTGETLDPGDPDYDFFNDIFEKLREENNS